MKIINKYFYSLVFSFLAVAVTARGPIKGEGEGVVRNHTEMLNSRMDCVQGMAETFMDVNNVRATLLTGGDVWWNLDQGKYVVPKPAPGELEVSSIFAGGVWIGGFDLGDNLKLAGVTYRTTQGTDYYPGPLTEEGVTDFEQCSDWDIFFEVTAEDIQAHIIGYETAVANGLEYDCDSIPLAIRQWPGRGNPDWDQFYDFELPDQPLGDFFDNDDDGQYDPCEGDFPFIFIERCPTDERERAKELVPDQMIYWIYNDNGGPHFNSRATAIQMEVQVQAFAYATNDELNDMTFQRYRLINKAESVINRCYFAMWVDPDLGCSEDDFIGCRVPESLMYVYNEDDVDGNVGSSCQVGGSSTNTYGADIPILGVDYFRGPGAPKVYLRDSDGNVLPDSILIDPTEENPLDLDTIVELGMTSFTYHNRIDQTTGDPQSGEEYYNYLTGRWRDGTPFTFGGNGYNPGSTDSIAYAFTGNPDDPNGWSMCTADLPFDDRRTVQATGPLTLQPTAINELIIGVVWVPNIDYPCPNLEPLLSADILAQNLFDACFDITDGPDAPDMCAVELDRELILVLSNDTVQSNNKFLTYAEVDLRSSEVEDSTSTGPRDSLYRFEGYRIYQLVDAGVSVSELDDPSRAIQIGQVDIQNGVTSISNWFSTPNPDPTLPAAFFPVEQVNGQDAGIRHTFQILNDAFASGDNTRLINHKRYYYTVVSYAYNNFQSFDQTDRTGQRTPYLEGRRNVRTYTFVPRPIVYDSLKSDYGFGPSVTRISGQGSGGIDLAISKEMRESIASGQSEGRITYNIGSAPIDVKIFDPFSIKDKNYRLEILGETQGSTCTFGPEATWVLTDLDTDRQFFSETDLSVANEQVIYGEGFSLSVNQVAEPTTGLNICDTDNPGFLTVLNNGAVAQRAEYEDPVQINAWYEIMPEQIIITTEFGSQIINNDYVIDGATPEAPFEADPDGNFSALGSNIFQPFYHMSNRAGVIASPAAQDFNLPNFQREEFCQNRRLDTLKLSDLNNVDIVFTPNKDLWSRCIVVEGANSATLQGTPTIGNVEQFELRQSPSVDKDGNEDGDGIGMGWFPGYAIDVENGQRLNIFFAENSSLAIGQDMIWNPDDNLITDADGGGSVVSLGGNHYVYVTRTEYDECASFRSFLENNPGRGDVAAVTAQITWASFPKLIGGQELLPISEGLIPNELTVSCRVNNPFGLETFVDQDNINLCSTYEGNPTYEFSFDNVAPLELNEEQRENALSNVRVVPNPYYAFSSYESSSFDNIVRVTNLPARAEITIYTLDGKFIRRFSRDEQPMSKEGSNPAIRQTQVTPDLEWDLNNFAGVPVASGVYIFHIVDVVNGNERSIKWFGVKRRFDPSGL